MATNEKVPTLKRPPPPVADTGKVRLGDGFISAEFPARPAKMPKFIIAAALFAFCAPAWAGGGHGGQGIGGTAATSTSGFQASGEGRSSASGTFSNKSRGENRDGASITSSKSRGTGESSKHGGWDGYSEGAAHAFTLGGFGHH